MTFTMGIDLGTSALKVVLIDNQGNIHCQSRVAYSVLYSSGGHAEQDPKTWWNACVKAVRECSKSVNDIKISGIGLSGQMHGLVALDEKKEVLRPAILHCDLRSKQQLEYMKNNVDMDYLNNNIINPLYTGFLIPSLLWVKDNEPNIFSRIRYVMLPKDYIKYKLTGIIETDYSDASGTLAYDMITCNWANDMLLGLGINPGIFPKISSSTKIIGCLDKRAAVSLEICEDIPVVNGGGDQLMQSIGNGVISKGQGTINIGSSGQVSFFSDKLFKTSSSNLNVFCGWDKNNWYVMGAIMNAGLAINWICDLLKTDSIKNLDDLIQDTELSGLIFLPYLLGERTPHANPDLSGMFAGLKITTDSKQMLLSVLEGIAFSLKQSMNLCLELGINSKKVILSGGGAKIKKWRQIQSNIYGIPLITVKCDEQAAVGAAITAAVGTGTFNSLEEACNTMIEYDETITPNDELTHQYEKYYSLFCELQTINSILEKISKVNENPIE